MMGENDVERRRGINGIMSVGGFVGGRGEGYWRRWESDGEGGGGVGLVVCQRWEQMLVWPVVADMDHFMS